MDFFAFNKAYAERLRNGDRATEHRFFVYFDKLVQIKLRAPDDWARQSGGLKTEHLHPVDCGGAERGRFRQPKRFGAFVNSICNNVLLEYYRALGNTHEKIPDKVLGKEGMMVSEQCSDQVRKILSRLPTRDPELLRAVFSEEKDKDTVCRDIGVDRNDLRALLHRAKARFEAVCEKEQLGALPPGDWIREFAKRFCGPPQRLDRKGPLDHCQLCDSAEQSVP